jgi:hypothetical protein
LPEPESINSGVVGDTGQVLNSRIPNGGDQGLRNATKAESTDRDHLAVVQNSLKGICG